MPRNILIVACVALLALHFVGCGALSASSATETYEAQCAAKDSHKCLYLGARLAKGEDVPADPVRGREFLGKACDLGLAQGCSMLAELLESGKGGPADAAAAAEKYAKACEAGYEVACAKAKKPKVEGDELSPDEQVAWCAQGKLAQCLGLGAAWLLSAESPGAADNAATYLGKACKGGAPSGCAMACELLAQGKGAQECETACKGGSRDACLALSRRSEGTTKRDWLDKACRAGDGQTCLELAIGLEKDADKAAKESLLSAGCAGGVAKSCALLGWAKATAGDAAAMDILAKACGLGDAEACSLSLLPTSEEKDPTIEKACAASKAKDCAIAAARQFAKGSAAWKKALQKAERSCLLQAGPACLLAAALTARLGGTKDAPAKASKLAQRGCDAGSGACCRTLAETAAKGSVRALLDKGCAAKDAHSCLRSGQAWQETSDGAKDGLRAMASYSKACELKDAKGCLLHGQLLAELASDSVSDQLVAFETACTLELPEGCRQAAMRSLEGKEDFAAARRRALIACDKGDAEGCRIAADLFFEGQGGGRDFAKAKELYGKSCDSALVVACVQRGKLR
jgi:hypothetical protein